MTLTSLIWCSGGHGLDFHCLHGLQCFLLRHCNAQVKQRANGFGAADHRRHCGGAWACLSSIPKDAETIHAAVNATGLDAWMTPLAATGNKLQMTPLTAPLPLQSLT